MKSYRTICAIRVLLLLLIFGGYSFPAVAQEPVNTDWSQYLNTQDTFELDPPIKVTHSSTEVHSNSPHRNDPRNSSTEAQSQKQKDWRFFVALYGWLATVNGTVVNGGQETQLDIPFEDILEVTEGGFQMYTEARWRKWFAAFDGTWANLAGDIPGRLLSVDWRVEQKIFDIRVGYELYRRYLEDGFFKSDADWQREAIVDFFIGGRYFSTKTKVKVTPIIGRQRQSSNLDERIDPFLGLRGRYDVTPRWALVLRGDIGGFGIGDGSQFTWQLEGTVGFRITRMLALLAGYRVLAFDTVVGDGVNRNGADLTQHGPIIGGALAF